MHGRWALWQAWTPAMDFRRGGFGSGLRSRTNTFFSYGHRGRGGGGWHKVHILWSAQRVPLLLFVYSFFCTIIAQQKATASRWLEANTQRLQ